VITGVLSAQCYRKRSKRQERTIGGYLMRVTGYGRAQITRLVEEYRRMGELPPRRQAPEVSFAIHGKRHRTAC
jgi:hypothetical protein